MVRWLWILPLAAAMAMSPIAVAAVPVLACAEQPSVLLCDADADGIVDVVEEAICGSATCATGAEDVDGDGIPDAQQLTESLASGGPGGPVQLSSPGMVIVVGADGTIAEFSLWPFAGVASLLLGVVGAYVVVRRRRSRPLGRVQHRVWELVP